MMRMRMKKVRMKMTKKHKVIRCVLHKKTKKNSFITVMPYKKEDKGALKKALKVYRLKIICKDPNEEDELSAIEDILITEDLPVVMNDLHYFYTWFYDEYEIEDMGLIELWSKKDFRHTMNWREFYSRWGYGEDLHV